MAYRNSAGYTYADCLAAFSIAPYLPRVDEEYWTASGKLTAIFQKEAAAYRGDGDGLSVDDKAEMQSLIDYLNSRADYFEALKNPVQPPVQFSDHETRPMWRQKPGATAGVMEKNPEYGVRAPNGLFPVA